METHQENFIHDRRVRKEHLVIGDFRCEALHAKLNKSIKQNFEIYDEDHIPELDM